MDPITAAIAAILTAVGSDVVKDAYEGLKAVIRRKWGDTAPISKAISALEEDPESEAQKAVLKEKVGAVKATEDAEVVRALNHLLEQMKTHGIGAEAASRIQLNMSGNMSGGFVHVAGPKGTIIVNNYGVPPNNSPVEKSVTGEEMAAIGGMWVDSNGSISQVMQTGESFRFESLNRQTGLRTQGTGIVKGRRFNIAYQTNIPSTGTGAGAGTVSSDGLEITETFQDFVFGVSSVTARKQ